MSSHAFGLSITENRPFGFPVSAGREGSGMLPASTAGADPAANPMAAACLSQRRRDCQTASGVISEGGGWGILILDISTPSIVRTSLPHVSETGGQPVTHFPDARHHHSRLRHQQCTLAVCPIGDS